MDVLALINLIAMIQAAFLGIHFLVKKKGDRLLNRMISIVILIFSIVLFNTYYTLSGFVGGNWIIQTLANHLMWFVAPALFLYSAYNQRGIQKRDLQRHFLPFALLFAVGVFFEWEAFDRVIPFVAFVQMITYLGFTVYYCRRDFNNQPAFYTWILPVVISFSILVLINFFLILLRISGITILPTDVVQSFTVLMTIPIFFLSYKEMNSDGNFGLKVAKYQTTQLPQGKVQRYVEDVVNLLEHQHYYRTVNLTLASVSEQLGIPSRYISQVINQQFDMSFSDYVTKLRLQEVKAHLADNSKPHLTIAGIAKEAGFASGSRFNFLFKKFEGTTPTQFKKAL